MSVEELANRLGLATGTVHKWERGDATPSLPLAYRIAIALGTDVASLVDNVD